MNSKTTDKREISFEMNRLKLRIVSWNTHEIHIHPFSRLTFSLVWKLPSFISLLFFAEINSRNCEIMINDEMRTFMRCFLRISLMLLFRIDFRCRKYIMCWIFISIYFLWNVVGSSSFINPTSYLNTNLWVFIPSIGKLKYFDLIKKFIFPCKIEFSQKIIFFSHVRGSYWLTLINEIWWRHIFFCQ